MYDLKITGKILNSPLAFSENVRIGSTASDSQVWIYDKTKVLRNNKKPYLEQYYYRNGFYQNKSHIERVELRMKSKACHDLQVDISRLSDVGYLFALFKKKAKNKLRFIVPSSDKNTSRQNKIDVIDWSLVPSSNIVLASRVQPNPLNIKAYKTLLKKLHILLLETGDQVIKEVIQLIFMKYPTLKQYYEERVT
jgi:hypothetical protein